MGQNINVRRPSQALQIGAGIAQGAQNFITAYQGVQAQQRAAAERQQMMQLRQAQLEMQQAEMNHKYGPVRVNLQKLQMLDNLSQAGLDVPSSVYKQAWDGVMEGVDRAPEVMGMINQGAVRAKSNKYALPTQTKAEQSGGVVVSQDPNPDAPATNLDFKGGMELTAEVKQPELPSDLTLSREEYELFKEGRKSAAQEKIWAQRTGAQIAIAKLNNDEKQNLQRLIHEGKVDLQSLVIDGQMEVQRLRNQGMLDAAKARGATSRANTQDRLGLQSIQALDRQIGEIRKAQAGLMKPNNLGMLMLPAQEKAQYEKLQQEIFALENQKSSVLKNLGRPELTGQAPAPAAKSKTPAPPRGKGPLAPQSKGTAPAAPGKVKVRRVENGVTKEYMLPAAQLPDALKQGFEEVK